MQPDELDRLLAGEGNISPSPRFAASVMSRVLREAQAPRSIGFPWTPVLAGIMFGAIAIRAAGGFTIEAAPAVLTAQTLAFTDWMQSWTGHIAAAAVNPTASALVLALMVAMVPMAVYEGYQRMRSTYP